MECCGKNGGVLVTGIGSTCLENIFDNGQCFRFVPSDDGYRGTAFAKRINISESAGGMFLFPCSMFDFENIWRNYLDLDRDYENLFDGKDEVLERCISLLPGLRILRQDPFEALISFIVSANNNIKRIRGIVERLCERFGEEKTDMWGKYYCFPACDVLAHADVHEFELIGAGYRAPYIKKTAQAVCDGFDVAGLAGEDYFTAKKKLCSLMGVGPKVADCILLFSLGHMRAFPVDVWIKRVLAECYGFSGKDRDVADFVYGKFGENAGIAQQYLFKNAIDS